MSVEDDDEGSEEAAFEVDDAVALMKATVKGDDQNDSEEEEA
jgi:hypothetical protein